MNETDVSTAQSFDVGGFFNNLLATGTALAAQKISASQNTGQPQATTEPNLRATPGGTASPLGGVSQQTLMTLGIGAAVVVGLVILLRK